MPYTNSSTKLEDRPSLNADLMGRSRDFTKVLPRPRKTLPPLEWDEDDPVATKRANNTLAARRSRAKKIDQVEKMRRQIEFLEEELKSSQEREKFWMEQAQNHDESSASPGSTFQSKQDILSPLKVPDSTSISSLIESVSTGACEPRDITAVSPQPRNSLPPLGWDRDDPITTTHAYNTFSARPYRERELGSSQEREKFWTKQSQNHNESSAPSGSTFQSNQHVSLLSGVSNRISITSLVESTSTGASEPRDCILSSQLRLFKCPHSGCATAPFKTKYGLE
jgi:hypothetical protein